MYRTLAFIALFAALGGQALAFIITVGTTNFTQSNILDIAQSPVTQECAVVCDPAKQTIGACVGEDFGCLCANATVEALHKCETCMLNFLVWKNIPAPDPRAGSNVAMTGYVAGCTAQNITVQKNISALAPPPGWEGQIGPFTAVLPVGGAVVYALVTGLLGISAIFLLSNM